MDYKIITPENNDDIISDLYLFIKPSYYNLINNSLVFNGLIFGESWLYVKNTSKALDYELFKRNNKICFDIEIMIQDLPDNITHITCYNEFQIVNLPKNLLYLSFIDSIDKEDFTDEQNNKIINGQSIINNLPFSLKYLAGMFYIPLDNLPQSLEYLHIYSCYEYELNNLPLGLKCLKINCNYNRALNNLPLNLIYLEINGEHFNQSLDFIPDSIEHIIISSNDTIKFNKLPINLKSLCIDEHFIIKNITILPQSLTKLYLPRHCTQSNADKQILKTILHNNQQLIIHTRKFNDNFDEYYNNYSLLNLY